MSGSVQADRRPEAAALLASLAPTAELFRAPAVEAAWPAPSTVERYTIGGLAGHLVRAVERTIAAFDEPVKEPDADPAQLTDWYLENRMSAPADLDDAMAAFLRDDGEQMGANGPAALAEALLDAGAAINVRLEQERADRLVSVVRTPRPVHVADYLASRVVEVVVHADDVAASAGIATPAFAPSVYDVVLGFCLTGARQRTSDLDVLRAMTRAERVNAPAEVLRIL